MSEFHTTCLLSFCVCVVVQLLEIAQVPDQHVSHASSISSIAIIVCIDVADVKLQLTLGDREQKKIKIKEVKEHFK